MHDDQLITDSTNAIDYKWQCLKYNKSRLKMDLFSLFLVGNDKDILKHQKSKKN